MEFDVLVLGGGTAGCVLAARLSEEPSRSVCLVEAGPDYGPYDEGGWPDDIVDGRQLAFSHSWETDREDRSQLRARILGGCSAHNACQIFEAPAEDYDSWGGGLEPYLARARETLRARRFEEHELSPWQRAFAELGADVNEANVVGSVRWNTAFAYLDEARDRPNLTILADTLVDRVIERAVLTSAGELRAQTIVLCAGAYGSPAILLRSGIEDGVGEGLVDHVGVGAAWEPTAELLQETGSFEASQPLFMAGVTLVDGDTLFLPAIDTDYEVSAAVFNMRPRSRGSVRLLGRVVDPLGGVRGFEGLYVADASIIPFVSRPPNLTVVALAERIAEALAE